MCGTQAARTLQDIAAERCSMPYRAPELFNVESYCMVDERTDIWVSSNNKMDLLIQIQVTQVLNLIIECLFFSVVGLYTICTVLL